MTNLILCYSSSFSSFTPYQASLSLSLVASDLGIKNLERKVVELPWQMQRRITYLLLCCRPPVDKLSLGSLC